MARLAWQEISGLSQLRSVEHALAEVDLRINNTRCMSYFDSLDIKKLTLDTSAYSPLWEALTAACTCMMVAGRIMPFEHFTNPENWFRPQSSLQGTFCVQPDVMHC